MKTSEKFVRHFSTQKTNNFFFGTNSKTSFSLCLNRQKCKQTYIAATITLHFGNKIIIRSKAVKKNLTYLQI